MDSFEKGLVELLPALKAFGTKLARNAADGEDLAQQTIVKALTYRYRFEEGTNLKAWTFVVLKNCWLSEKRKHSLEVEDPDGFLTGLTPDGVDMEEALDARRALDKLNRLSPKLQRALRHVGNGGTYEELANRLKVSVNTVKTRVHRARRVFGEMIG